MTALQSCLRNSMDNVVKANAEKQIEKLKSEISHLKSIGVEPYRLDRELRYWETLRENVQKSLGIKPMENQHGQK